MKLGAALWGWIKDRAKFFTSELTLLDVMRLVEDESCDAKAIVEKMYDWEHARRMEVGKWLLALAAIVVAGIVTTLGRQETVAQSLLLYSAVFSGIMAASGIATIWSARSVAAHFARTSALMGRLAAIRTFLSRLRVEEGL